MTLGYCDTFAIPQHCHDIRIALYLLPWWSPALILPFLLFLSGDARGDDAASARVQGQAAEGRQGRGVLAHQRADRSHDRDTRRTRGPDQAGHMLGLEVARFPKNRNCEPRFLRNHASYPSGTIPQKQEFLRNRVTSSWDWLCKHGFLLISYVN